MSGGRLRDDILVSPAWLADNLHRKDVKVLDASWFLPTMGARCVEQHTTCLIKASLRTLCYLSVTCWCAHATMQTACHIQVLAGRSAPEEFQAIRIPGSVRFDIDAVADTSAPLPHMLPQAQVFAAAADAVPVASGDTVVVYDRVGTFSSPRAWWTWTVFGHQRCACALALLLA